MNARLPKRPVEAHAVSTHAPLELRAPIIELRTLGTVALHVDDDAEGRTVLAQPKRFALLAYLALAQPRDFHRRDTLLALFWPELDEHHARNALSQALHELRRTLGPDALANRGATEIGLDWRHLWCDAAAFECALDEDRAAEAMALYRGDLLPGFHVPDVAPEFDQFLEAERGRLRERAAQGAWALAEHHEAGGQTSDAARWGRLATTLARDDEPAVRRLIGLLERTGDRTGALQVYDGFARRLAEVLEIAPSAETQALVAQLRTQPERAVTPVAPTSFGPARSTLLPELSPPQQARPSPRRRRFVLAALTLLATAITLSLRAFAGLTDSAAGVERVAVMPFDVRGGPGSSYLREGLVDLLSADLDGARGLRVVDPRAVLSASRSAPGAGAEDPRAVARRLGARLYVVGGLVTAGAQMQLDAALYDTKRGVRATARALADTAELFALVDAAVRQLVVSDQPGPGARLTHLAGRTTAVLPALRAWLDGERAYRAAQYDGAVEAFRRAVALDSTFALAWYRLSTAAPWIAEDDLARDAADRALRHADRLPRRDRLLLFSLDRLRHEDVAPAEQTLRYLVALYPDDIEAWYQLGDLLFHAGPLRGRPISLAREPFERVRLLEPDNQPALTHLMRLAAFDGRRDALDSLSRRAIPLAGGDQVLGLRAVRALGLRDRAATESVLTDLARSTDATSWLIAHWAAAYAGDLATAERIAALNVRPEKTLPSRSYHYVLLGYLSAARGRWRQATRWVHTADSLEPGIGMGPRAVLSLHAMRPRQPGELDSLEAVLIRRRAALAPYGRSADDNWDRPLIDFGLGLLRARTGDVDSALALAAELDTLHGDATWERYMHTYAGSIRAHLLWRQGRHAEAYEAFEALPVQLPEEGPSRHFPYTMAAERFARGELARELGRLDDAVRWYSSFEGVTAYDLPWLGPSRLRRAEIFDRLGERRRAAEQYQLLVELWKDADPELRPIVELARRRSER